MDTGHLNRYRSARREEETESNADLFGDCSSDDEIHPLRDIKRRTGTLRLKLRKKRAVHQYHAVQVSAEKLRSTAQRERC